MVLYYPDVKTPTDNATVSIKAQKAENLDRGEFVRFLESAVYNERFWLSAYGEARAWVGELKVELKGKVALLPPTLNLYTKRCKLEV